MSNLENKFPGKDVTIEDIKTKFPLVAKKNKNHRSKFKIAGVEFGGKLIPIFAGPNMVETKSLILNTAKNVKKIGAQFLRGGAFKPLTFPYRIPVITEVMEERFLPIICETSDILQIGSRNMQNFPLLTACAKTKKPIMLKRHYGSSLRDWLGAAEYLMVEGNKKILLCERGVSVPHTHRNTSRFLIDLQVVPAAKEITHLPVVVDPSHATFWRPWVPSMTLASIAAGADGIMLEVHPNPTKAAVDPLQPINFVSFKKLHKEMRAVAKSINRRID